MGFTKELLALVAAFLLAGGTAFGVVQSQQSAGEKNVTTPVSYGNNNG